jgi:hypothetical protein
MRTVIVLVDLCTLAFPVEGLRAVGRGLLSTSDAICLVIALTVCRDLGEQVGA